MFDDIAQLISTNYVTDEVGNEIRNKDIKTSVCIGRLYLSK